MEWLWIALGAGALYLYWSEKQSSASVYPSARGKVGTVAWLIGQKVVQSLPATLTDMGEERVTSQDFAHSSGIPVLSGGELGYPLAIQGVTYTGGRFGFWRSPQKQHKGLDLWVPTAYDGIGTPVLSVAPGRVVFIVDEKKFRARHGKLQTQGTTMRKGRSYPAVLPATTARPALYPFSVANAGRKYSDGAMGLEVSVTHDDGMRARYMHLSGLAPDLKVGQRVSKGTVLGYLGGTDVMVDRPHLHIDLMKGGKFLDPEALIGG